MNKEKVANPIVDETIVDGTTYDYILIPTIYYSHNHGPHLRSGNSGIMLEFDLEKYFNGKRLVPVYIEHNYSSLIKENLNMGGSRDLECLLQQEFENMKNRLKRLPWWKRLFNKF